MVTSVLVHVLCSVLNVTKDFHPLLIIICVVIITSVIIWVIGLKNADRKE